MVCLERCQKLSGFLAERRFLPEEEARELFRQVLEAVQHCTSSGVLHGDIKPENFLLDLASGQLKLNDFGCGTFLQDTAYTQFAGEPWQGMLLGISWPSLGAAPGLPPVAAGMRLMAEPNSFGWGCEGGQLPALLTAFSTHCGLGWG
uniref:Serine/threonine-protein kinase 1 n=1 Tax=Serinus canaria TaxID=9135 RepID=A0A8C9NBG2_SERCA